MKIKKLKNRLKLSFSKAEIFYLVSIFFLAAILSSYNFTAKQEVDLLVYNAKVYTVDKDFSMADAFVVTDGKFVEVGIYEELKDKYMAADSLDAQGKSIFPGLIEGHGHFLSKALEQQSVDLVDTNRYGDTGPFGYFSGWCSELEGWRNRIHDSGYRSGLLCLDI